LSRQQPSGHEECRYPLQDGDWVVMDGHQKGRVLLVDDEPLIQKLISTLLVSAGYVVQTAVDGLDGLGKLRAELPDLIISDLNMDRMSGREFLDVVRKRFPQIPVIVTTAEFANEMPSGVTADAYYYKGGLPLQPLLETISELTNKPPLRTGLPLIDNGPAQAKWDGDGQYLIECKDCLRVFSFPHTPDVVRDEKWTICIHCGNLVRFLMAAQVERV